MPLQQVPGVEWLGCWDAHVHALLVSTLHYNSYYNYTFSIGQAEVTSGKGAMTVSGLDLSGTRSIEGRFIKTRFNIGSNNIDSHLSTCLDFCCKVLLSCAQQSVVAQNNKKTGKKYILYYKKQGYGNFEMLQKLRVCSVALNCCLSFVPNKPPAQCANVRYYLVCP